MRLGQPRLSFGQPESLHGKAPLQQPAPGGEGRHPQTFRVKSVLGNQVSIQGGPAIGAVPDINLMAA
jgi:hypothetical protein